MRDKLRWFHRWIGLPLGIMFFVTLATGAVTGFDQVRSNMDDRGQTYRATTLAEDGAAIDFITSKYQGLSSVVLPTEGKPYYQAKSRGDRALVSIADEAGEHTIIQEMEYARGPIFTWMFELHRSYLLGRANESPIGIAGSKITALMALTAVFVSLLGVYLWWPFRSKYNVKQAVPMSNKRRAYFNAHLTSGLIVVGAIVVLGMSGAGLYFRTEAGAVLGANPEKEVGLLESPETLAEGWASWLETAALKIPDGKMKSVDFPRGAPPGGAGPGGAPGGQAGFNGGAQGMAPPQGGAGMGPPPGGFQRGQGAAGMAPPGGGVQGVLTQAASVRFVTDEDWLSVPSSRVYINQTSSELVGLKRFGQNTFGQKLFEMMNPLHTGNNITTPYIVVMTIFVALAAIMIFSGVLSMLINLLKKKRESGSIVVVSKGEADKLATVTIEAPGSLTDGAPAE